MKRSEARRVRPERSRWAAIGAAIAVSFGAGGVGIGHATTDAGPMPIFRPLDAPCRLADTRPAPDTVGPRTSGIGPGETYDLDGWGTVGDCSLPTGTAALQLNVTAIGATRQTNVRFFPTGASLPTTANLNPSPGASPTPNAVTVGLAAGDGGFSVFNAFGTVAVVVDVIGVYHDHVHTGDDIVDGSLTNADLRDEPGVAFSSFNGTRTVKLERTVATVQIRPPSDGYVTVTASGYWATGRDLATLFCQISDGGVVVDFNDVYVSDHLGPAASSDIMLHRTYPVTSDASSSFARSFTLVCSATNSVSMRDVQMTATYSPTSYAPPVLTSPEGDG